MSPEREARDLPDALWRAVVDTLPTEFALLDGEGTILYTNEEWRRFAVDNGMVGAEAASVGENYLAVAEGADDDHAREAVEGLRAVLAGDRSRFRLEYPCHSPDERRWFLMQARRLDRGGDRYAVVEHLDITDRKLAELDVRRKNQRLEGLHGAVQELLQADSPQAVADLTVASIEGVLGHPLVGCWLYDPDRDVLEPAATSGPGVDLIDDVPTYGEGESLSWAAFEAGTSRVVGDLADAPGRYNPETPIRSELILPLGDHGLLNVGATEPHAFDETDVTLAELWATTVTLVLSWLDNESRLRERERHLEQLQRRTRELMHTGSPEATARVAVDAARDILGIPMCGVHRLDDDGDALVPLATLDEVRDELDTAPTYRRNADDPSAAVVWEAFERGEPLVVADTREHGRLAEVTPVRSGIVHPLGDMGVFIVSSTTPDDFDGTDQRLVEILATSLAAALDRTERERLLRERERDLERENDRLEAFASLVSHDLRNPLNVAQGRLDLARETGGGDHLDAVGRALDRMDRLVDDLLALAREGETVGSVEPVALDALVDRCWANVDTAGADLVVATDLAVRADEGRLAQVFENLFRNAIEHGGPGVTITVGTVPGDRGFYVEDDGPGIPEGEREAVFDAGYSTAEGGTGFGLSIVGEIVEAHGWEIRVAGGDGGARFEVTGVDPVS